MKFSPQRLLAWLWPWMILSCYLIYSAIVQYSSLPTMFSTIAEADQLAWHLKFPGMGLSFRGGTSDRPGEIIRMYEVEYLFRHKDRVFVIAGHNGTFRVIDEFVSRTFYFSVELKDGKLRYSDYSGKVVLERNAQPSS